MWKKIDKFIEKNEPECFILLVILLLGGMIAYFGISARNYKIQYETVVVEKKVVMVEITAIASQPKHFYIDLNDLDTGDFHHYVYVSKHFNEWGRLKFPVKFEVERTTSRYIHLPEKKHEVYFNNGDLYDGLYRSIK